MKKYPILGTNDFLPFELMLIHEKQCLINHQQNVEQLANRGGTTYFETYFILKDSKIPNTYFHYTDEEFIKLQIRAKLWVQSITYEYIMRNEMIYLQ